MAYSDKVWKDSPDHTTPLSAAGLNDWEARIKAETDALSVLAAQKAAANTFTKAQTITPDSDAVPLVLNQRAAATGYALQVNQQAAVDRGVLFTFTGGDTSGPYTHWNRYGWGIVGDGTNPPPYFAIESSALFESVFKMQMLANATRDVTMSTYSTTGIKPTFTIRAEEHIKLQPNRDSTGADNAEDGYVMVQAYRGLAVQNVAGNTNYFQVDPALNKIGFWGSKDTQKTITGSRGGNAALASLLTALAAYGLVVDGSS